MILHHIATALERAIAGLTGAEITARPPEKSEIPSEARKNGLKDPIVWQQSLSLTDGPSLWIAAGRDLWESASKLILETAGVDAISEEDCRSTWQEVLGQTAGGVANALTADLMREVTSTGGEVVAAEPSGLGWRWLALIRNGESTCFRVAWSTALETRLHTEEADGALPALPPQSLPAETSGSRTFDLLLDVALPVCVSFGRTSLQVREVLKLNTGSIVELNRFASDPVDVVVNGCVIARGEVVVVDGNYGVRISQLSSREDRLKTGMNQPEQASHRAPHIPGGRAA